jgi:hypothetical protein
VAVLSSVLLFHNCYIVVSCCVNSNISTHILSQKTVIIFYLADTVCLYFFGFFGENVCIHCFDFSFISALTIETHISSPATVPCYWGVFRHVCGIALKSQSRNHSLRFMRTCEHFRKTSRAKLVIAYPNCDNLVKFVEICQSSEIWSAVLQKFFFVTLW